MKVKAKKLTALLSAMVLALALGMTAFAAGSASTGGVTSDATSDVPVTISSTNVAGPSVADLQQILGSAFVEGMHVIDVIDVSVPAGTPMPVTITFSVPGVTANSNVAVLHYDGSKWETSSVSGVSAGNGTITATFASLSPVALVADTAASSSSSSTASPKTGEPTTVVLIGGIALLAAAGAYGLKRKRYPGQPDRLPAPRRGAADCLQGDGRRSPGGRDAPPLCADALRLCGGHGDDEPHLLYPVHRGGRLERPARRPAHLGKPLPPVRRAAAGSGCGRRQLPARRGRDPRLSVRIKRNKSLLWMLS